MCLFLVALGLSGPFLMVLGVLAGRGLVVTGMVCTVALVPLGFVVGLTVAAERRHNRRLDAFGVPAVAEITELTEGDTGDDGGAVVVLRVSGLGFRTFEATWKRSQHPPCVWASASTPWSTRLQVPVELPGQLQLPRMG